MSVIGGDDGGGSSNSGVTATIIMTIKVSSISQVLNYVLEIQDGHVLFACLSFF